MSATGTRVDLARGGDDGQRGFTLVEVMVAVALVALVGAVAARSIVIAPLAVHADAQRLADAIAATEALAAVLAGDPAAQDGTAVMRGTGATLEVTSDGSTTTLRVLQHRPITGATVVPDARTAPTTLSSAVELADASGRPLAAPFAIFVAPSGRLSAGGSWSETTRYAAEPQACGASGALVVRLTLGTASETYAIGCDGGAMVRMR